MGRTEKLEVTLPQEPVADGLDAWLRDEVLPVLDGIEAGEDRPIPADEVFEQLRAQVRSGRG